MLPTLLRALAAVLILLSANSAGAATVSLPSSADAFVTNGPSNNLSDNNYGGGGSFAVSAAGLPKGEFQSVIQFDASLAKSTFDTTFGAGLWTLTDAKLQLTASPPVNGIFNGSPATNTAGLFNIEWMSDDSWTEGTGNPTNPAAAGINYTTLPGFLSAGVQSLNLSGVPFSFDGSTSTTTPYTLAPSAGFLSDIYSGSLESLNLSAADSTVSALFNSRSFMNVATRPALILTATAVPEPGRTMLLGLGFAMMLGRRKRK